MTALDFGLRAWPTGSDLADWMEAAALSADSILILDTIVAESSAVVLRKTHSTKRPDQTLVNTCPVDYARLIILYAARLLSRRSTPEGIVDRQELSIRIANSDADYRIIGQSWFNRRTAYPTAPT